MKQYDSMNQDLSKYFTMSTDGCAVDIHDHTTYTLQLYVIYTKLRDNILCILIPNKIFHDSWENDNNSDVH